MGAGFGADVVKIEPPAGAPSRRIGPFYRDEIHPDRSLHFWHYNVGKRAAAVDLTSPQGRALLKPLAERCDVVIAAGAPMELETMGLLDGEALRRANPRLILVTITPFGLDGPWHDRPATDLTLMALGGSMAACGYGPDDPPLTCAGWQAYQTACVYAVHGLMGAVLARDTSGRGQDVEVSIHEAAVSITEWHVPQYVFTGLVSPRAVLGLQFLARDGIMVSTIVVEFLAADMLDRLHTLLAPDGLDGALSNPALRTDRKRLHSTMVSTLERYCARHTADEIYRTGQSVGFPWAPCRTPDENLDDPHLHDRGFWVPVYHPDLDREFLYAGAPFIMPACPWRLTRRPPLLGEHTAEVLVPVGVDGVELQRLNAAGAVVVPDSA